MVIRRRQNWKQPQMVGNSSTSMGDAILQSGDKGKACIAASVSSSDDEEEDVSDMNREEYKE